MKLWLATVLAAVAIVGASVYIAISRQQPATQPSPVYEAAPAVIRPAPVPGPETQFLPLVPTFQEESIFDALPEEYAEETGPARLRLDNLAGMIDLQIPFLAERTKIPLEHTCFLQNESPALSWRDAPLETLSYVVFMEKRSAQGEVINWMVYNIPADETGLAGSQPQDGLPNGALYAINDYGITGYSGPCEPKGTFSYALRVFALDKMLDADAGTSRDSLIRAMNGHIIDAAEREFIHYKLM